MSGSQAVCRDLLRRCGHRGGATASLRKLLPVMLAPDLSAGLPCGRSRNSHAVACSRCGSTALPGSYPATTQITNSCYPPQHTTRICLGRLICN